MADMPELDIQMDPNALYREEIYTDRKIGTIRALVPVTAEGATDLGRKVVYIGEAQIVTQVGPLPVSFDIDAPNLQAAVAAYGAAAKAGVEKTIQQLQELRRQQASSIIVPGTEPGGVIGGGGMPPGLGGGGFRGR
jgi:hypothetical protein